MIKQLFGEVVFVRPGLIQRKAESVSMWMRSRKKSRKSETQIMSYTHGSDFKFGNSPQIIHLPPFLSSLIEQPYTASHHPSSSLCTVATERHASMTDDLTFSDP